MPTANEANHFFERCFMAPLRQRLFGSFREPEIQNRPKVEFRPIESACFEQLSGANQSQFLIFFVAENILSPFAASQAEKGSVRMESSRKPGQRTGAFIIGMSCYLQHPHIHRQFFQGSENSCCPSFLRKGVCVAIPGPQSG